MRDLDEICPGYDKAAALPDPFGWTERHLFRSEGVPIAEIPRGVKGMSPAFRPANLPDTDGIPHIDQNLPDDADRRFDVNLAEVPLHGAIVPALRPHRKMSNEKAPPPSGERALISCRNAEAPCPHAASASTPSMAAVTWPMGAMPSLCFSWPRAL